MLDWPRIFFGLLIITLVGGCASLPPGADFPKTPSLALAHPEETRLGRQTQAAAVKHDGHSGFRMISAGIDGFLMRMQMINAAERTLDLQYFIFRGDETGQLLTAAVLRAADRGVRVRILIDDGETMDGDEQIAKLDAHAAVEVRVFNPFAYRGASVVLRGIEFLFNFPRLDYRMHNKLMAVDNAIALVGGRNIGDQYFQIDPESQFADDDVFVVGPMSKNLSASFDEFWNNGLSIPAAALAPETASHTALNEHREVLKEQQRESKSAGPPYVRLIETGEPLKGILSGRLPLIWAPARLISDSPDKKKVTNGAIIGRLMHREVADAAAQVENEFLMITPYLIPGKEGMAIFDALRKRNVHVRILTSSLESATVLLAHSGYMKYRAPLLENGVELFEIRSLLGNARGSGQTAAISRYGNYSLHAKLFVFDRKQVFIGSMNFDQRSMHLNTEIGLIIDSPELAQQAAARFDAMVQPVNAYCLVLRPNEANETSTLVWRTQEGEKLIDYDAEPARSRCQRFNVHLLSLLPLDSEL